jgi:hypothetical protein
VIQSGSAICSKDARLDLLMMTCSLIQVPIQLTPEILLDVLLWHIGIWKLFTEMIVE